MNNQEVIKDRQSLSKASLPSLQSLSPCHTPPSQSLCPEDGSSWKVVLRFYTLVRALAVTFSIPFNHVVKTKHRNLNDFLESSRVMIGCKAKLRLRMILHTGEVGTNPSPRSRSFAEQKRERGKLSLDRKFSHKACGSSRNSSRRINSG